MAFPLVAQMLGFLYGSVTLASFTILSLLDAFLNRTTRHRPPAAEQTRLLRESQHKFWSLDDEGGLGGLHHDFLSLKSGLKLHYIKNTCEFSATKLIVCLHGFPDSCLIYQNILRSSKLQSTGVQLVAIDLPGCGGSEDFERYGAGEILNGVAEAIALLKSQYLADDAAECILVGHDWGGIIAYRIAAETSGLVNRVVSINTAYMPLLRRNASTAVSGCKAHLNEWPRRPFRVSALLAARRAIAPLIAQLLNSSYIFMFNLPLLVLAASPSLPLWYLLDGCHRIGHHRREGKGEVVADRLIAESQAASFGPGSAECTHASETDKTYGSSVYARTRTNPPGDWLQRIRVYREGLASGRWRLGAEVQQYVPDRGSNVEVFKCPVTVINGVKDFALDPRMNLDGIERFFAGSGSVTTRGNIKNSSLDGDGSSHIVRLQNIGHWSLLEEPVGSGALESTLLYLVSQQGRSQSRARLEDALSQQFGDEVVVATYT